ncbi:MULTISPECIES: PepSY-associated TM helix domain-containing protein [Bacteroides]|uniref:PepSY domain-containing protein n=1 Tax=Bacteroides oleiciplenus YIT 12058 TaxID=742727 RepID=K9EN02_9BACE|nr:MULTISPECIES: PepSY-associated TM helix domain-containing protein [Bacteroides]EKU92322.1 hypothetical protein HMPREF9447_00772 [Bacteroides oleiciplenus YIT 12058]
MKKITWKRHHKWLGIILSLFMLMFCVSGIILNHRTSVADVNISRAWLPHRYHYKNWNGGLLRGTLPYMDKDSVHHVLVYGTGGIWKTDSAATSFDDFNKGLPCGADYRQMKTVIQAPDGDLYAVSPFGLYRHGGIDSGWRPLNIPVAEDELLTDMACRDDTLVVAGRSFLYVSAAPYKDFRKIQLKTPDDYDGKVTLLRTVWLLHSGELFGFAGKIIVDAIAVVLIILCLTGILYWLLPKYIRRRRQRGKQVKAGSQWLRASLLWHDKIGRMTILLTLFIVITGWCLRPPVMILLALNKVGTVPGTILDSPNGWNDKLRMLRYDNTCHDWLLSTSEGFYSLKSLEDVPLKIAGTPPVSVMGLNVLRKDDGGKWLCGSFSGMFTWDRLHGTATDYFTHEPAPETSGAPFGKKAISGYSTDMGDEGFTVEYYEGTNIIPQPEPLATLPMSLWNVALEVHSGRIYMGIAATYVFIFFAGLTAVWCLWSGWKLRRRKKK